MNKTKKLLLLAVVLFNSWWNLTWSQQWNGYTLYSVQNSTATYLIDTNSTTYHTWTHASTAKTGYSSYLMPGGILWRSVTNSSNSITGGGVTGRVQKVDYSGNVLWDFTYSSSTYVLHHDICPLPNGNVLLISYDVKTAAEATQAGCSQSMSIRSEKIMEVQPTGSTTGTVVWEWKLWDHLVQDYNSAKDNYASSVLAHPELLDINYNTQNDWIHMNGIDYNPALDQIAVSSHNLNQWFIIDHSTTTTQAATHTGGNAGKGGDFLYRYGNPGSYEASGSTVLNVTHDTHWIPEDVANAGRLVGFNNYGVSSTQSSIDQIDVPRVGYNYSYTPGSAYIPTTYTARRNCSGVSSNMGSSEQYPNGNMLICMATQGTMYEINSAGTVLWTKTASGTVPQAHRYSSCYISNAAPATPTITASNGILTASSATTYQWYVNGDAISGATAQSYTPATSGKYVVRITDANGCVYMYSAAYTVTLPATPAISSSGTTALCSGGSVTLTASSGTSYLWSNGATTQSITVSTAGSYTVNVYNASGFFATSATTVVTSGTTPATPIISVSGATTICTGDVVILSASLSDHYLWSTGDTTSTITVSTTGNYTVTITNSAGCSATSSTQTVTVNNTPVIGSGTITSPATCGTANGSIGITGTESGTVSWTGTTSGTATGITLPYTIAGLGAGSYNISFNNGTCTSNILNTSISDPNAPIVNAGDNQEICSGSSITLSAAGAVSYTWDNGITDGASFTPIATTTYTVIGTDASGCQASDQVTVTVNATPTVSQADLTDICVYTAAFTLTGGSPSGGTYSGNGVSGGNFDPNSAGVGTSTITYSYTDNNGCSASTQTSIVVEECLGITEASILTLQVYPNPASDFLIVEHSEPIAFIEVYDQIGKCILQFNPDQPATIVHINLSAFEKGTYHLRVVGTEHDFIKQSTVVKN